MAATSSQNAITLKGSTEIVSEFFWYGINSILYQRGIYPPEDFTRVQQYGLTLLVSSDDALKNYLNEVLSHVKKWLLSMTVKKLVVVIKDIDTNEVMERWQFDVECDKTVLEERYIRTLRDQESQTAKGYSSKMSTQRGDSRIKKFYACKPREKSVKEINKEICSVIRQITASVTFLPLLESACAFDLLVYTDKDVEVPSSWGEDGPHFIANSEEVRLRSFSTSIHKLDTMVAYKKTD